MQPARFSIRPGIDRGRSGKRMPPKLPRRVGHHLREPVAPQRRHGVFALPRSLEDVAARVNPAVEISGFARYAELVLDLVVVRLELVEAERPILNRGSPGNARRAVASRRLAHHFEVPGIETPALRPIVKRWCHRPRSSSDESPAEANTAPTRSADASALRDWPFAPPAASRGRCFATRPVRNPPARASVRLRARRLESSPRERQGRHAAHGTEPDDDDICPGQVNRHACVPLFEARPRGPLLENIGWSYADL